MHESEAPYESRAKRAVVADDDAFARRAICQLLTEAGIVVVAEAADGEEAIELAREQRPDLVLIDAELPGVDGVAATRRIVDERPEQLVVLTCGREDVDVMLMGLRAGAKGYVSKELTTNAFTRAIRGALAGEAAISRVFMRRVIEHLRVMPNDGAGLRPVRSRLTRREWEVLDLICDGRTTDEIARLFVVSEETIRSHVKRILPKLGVSSREQAVATVRHMRSAGV